MTTTPLLSPQDVKALLPTSLIASEFIREKRAQARALLQRMDSRKVLIVGPCSIHDRSSAIEYARQMKDLSAQVEKTCFLIMRVYIEKPRTSVGWKGFLYDPHLNDSCDIQTGILWTRELLLLLAEMRVPCAAEFVDPLAALYFEDLLTWGFIGARTSASQPHRQFVSQLDLPVGFKNSTDGNIENPIHGVLAARVPHASLHIDPQGRLSAIQSEGNPHVHIVLRGSDAQANCDPASIQGAIDQLQHYRLPCHLMIDCSHGNARKCFQRQQEVFLSVLEREEERVFGFMIESHLESGSQLLTENPSHLKATVSITDPCLDWKTTRGLIEYAHCFLGSFKTPRQ